MVKLDTMIAKENFYFTTDIKIRDCQIEYK